jgi:uncharacterized protein YgbK (DUF1537 family)
MLHTLTALQGAEHFLIAAARLWAAAGELLTAGAILWTLDALARSIRAAYAMGRTAGRILWPVIHATAAAVRWFFANVDWRFVAAVVFDCLKVLVVAAYVAAVLGRRLLIAASAALGRRYAATVAPAAPIAPAAYHPAAMIAGELSTLTCAQLRALTGCRRKLPKAQLIALAIAA